MKKIIFLLTIAILMISMMTVTAFAHGGHGNGYKTQTRQQHCHELCTVAGCNVVELHRHDGVWYCSQTRCYNYEICTVGTCTEIDLHDHNGIYYRCANFDMERRCGRW